MRSLKRKKDNLKVRAGLALAPNSDNELDVAAFGGGASCFDFSEMASRDAQLDSAKKRRVSPVGQASF